MRILSITAQKPDSTGSGVYLAELVRELAKEGHEQAVICGIGKEDKVRLAEGVQVYPVVFGTEELPFPVAGMSDEMPYESTVYSRMDEGMTERFCRAFRSRIRAAAEQFRPDLVLCHHLYLVTAIAREELADIPVYGFCHNTDLGQMRRHDLKKEYILREVAGLDRIYTLHEAQKEEIRKVYSVDPGKLYIAGVGYNEKMFFQGEEGGRREERRLVFAGKISRAKGVESLLRSLSFLEGERLTLTLAGGSGNTGELERIEALAKRGREAGHKVEFAGRLPQEKLADLYRQSSVFVLPSFYEGLPLTVMEALACGDRVVVTDLPGIRPFFDTYLPGAPIWYVKPPALERVDEPRAGTLPAFERELACRIREAVEAGRAKVPDLSEISWAAVCRRILA